MKNLNIGVLCLSVAGRVWTSLDGRSVEAELVSYDAESGMITLKRQGGREFKLKRDALSPEDNTYLDQMEKDREEENQRATAKKAQEAERATALAGTTQRYTTDGPFNLSYHCYYPKSYAGEKLPVLILFSPGGNGRNIMKNFLPVGDQHHWLIVGCDKLKNGLKGDTGDKWFAELLPHIEKHLPMDPDLMYMGGMSGGAMRAYNYSAKFDRPWKGIIACGGWLGGSDYEGTEYCKKMAVAIVNGDADNNANAWIERDTSELNGRRCKVKVFDFDGGHVIAPPEVLDEAVEWIIKNTRSKK